MNLLEGVRIVEMADDIAGPYCGKLFADFGAEVIKVESSAGDQCRRRGTGRHCGDDGALFTFLNAGKRSTLGLYGDSRVEELIASADILIDSSGPVPDRPRRLTPSLATFGDCSDVTVRPDRSVSRQTRDRVHAAGRERNHGSAGAARPTPIASRRSRLRMGPR